MNLAKKIKSKTAVVGIVGLGYVGLPLAIEFEKAGFSVIGVDISPNKIEKLKRGESYIMDISNNKLKNAILKGNLEVYTEFGALNTADCICIAVPTPLNKSREPDLSFIQSAVQEIINILHKDMLIVLESTTYPGATRDLLANRLEFLGYRIGKDVFVTFSPERVDPGNIKYKTHNIPKVIGGITPECRKMARALYGLINNNLHLVKSVEEAEMVKLLENTFRAVNIGLVNEMAMMCDRMQIDIWSVIEAAATKPFGFMKFLPGPGLGGHCIPLDPVYLSYRARSYNYYNRFIELATDINGNMPNFVINKLTRILSHNGKCLKNAKILIMGIAYKENINDMRESPGLEIFKLLESMECHVDYHDPFIKEFNQPNDKKHRSIKINDIKKIASYDCILITTAHSSVNYKRLQKYAKCIFDTRNAYNSIEAKNITYL